MPPFEIGGLGEIAIRCTDMAAMCGFYGETLGLELMAGGPEAEITFFRIAPGVAGHTTVLALFDHRLGRPGIHPAARTPPETGARSSLHHIALSLPWDEQEKALAWYRAQDIPHRVERFGWVGWRGIFTTDPEGNTVELVAHHPDLQEGP